MPLVLLTPRILAIRPSRFFHENLGSQKKKKQRRWVTSEVLVRSWLRNVSVRRSSFHFQLQLSAGKRWTWNNGLTRWNQKDGYQTHPPNQWLQWFFEAKHQIIQEVGVNRNLGVFSRLFSPWLLSFHRTVRGHRFSETNRTCQQVQLVALIWHRRWLQAKIFGDEKTGIHGKIHPQSFI